MPEKQAQAAMMPCRQAPGLPQPSYCRQPCETAALTLKRMKLAALASISSQHLIRPPVGGLHLGWRTLQGLHAAEQQSSLSRRSLHSMRHEVLSRYKPQIGGPQRPTCNRAPFLPLAGVSLLVLFTTAHKAV